MANEAVTIEAGKINKRYTISGATTISGGTLLQLYGDNRAMASDGTSRNVFAGVASEQYVGGTISGDTEIGAWIDGTYDLVCTSNGVTLGGMVTLSGANLIGLALEADFPLGKVFGKALETGSGSEKIRVRLGLN